MINFESKTLIILKKNNIKLICLAGFMKVLSDKFIKNFKYTSIFTTKIQGFKYSQKSFKK